VKPLSSKNWVYAVAGMILGCTTLQAQEMQKADTPFDPKAALATVYGGNTWRDPQVARYFRLQSFRESNDLAYVSLGFDESYVEKGHPKHVIVSLLTPEPPESYGCHACEPLMGAAVLTLAGGRWEIESVSKIIEFIAGGSRFSLVRAGPDRYALLLHQQDYHQGYELNRFDILLADDGRIRQPLSIGFNENPSPSACSDATEQSVDLSFDTAGRRELYDVLTVVKRNEGQCGHVKAIVERGRYKYVENVYRLSSQ
jgi:hypothetical protein